MTNDAQRGWAELREVVRCLRETGRYFDDEGEATNALDALLATYDAPVDVLKSEARYRVMKASGSRYAHVIDTQSGGSVARYDVLRKDGWTHADQHAVHLNSAEPTKE